MLTFLKTLLSKSEPYDNPTTKVYIDEVVGWIELPIRIADAFDRLRAENNILKRDKETAELNQEAAENKLALLKPIVEDVKYLPAKSRECYKCHYGIKLPYTYDRQVVYGCRKNLICEDFKEDE